jgi:hypothetical protein
MDFAVQKAEVLGEHAEKILESPSFFNARWLNATYRTKQWQGDIESIVSQANDDILSIQSTAGKNAPALMAHYYETLSLERARQFMDSIKQASEGDFNGESSGRALLILGIVFLVAYIVIMGWANQYTDVLKYFELIFGNAVFIATVAAVYLASWGCDSNLNDLPYRKAAAAEEEHAQN